MKIVFFGTSRFAQIVLETLVNSPFAPTLVITAPDTKVGRGRKLQASPVKQMAIKNNIEVLQPESLSDKNFQFSIFNFQFDLAILVAYGKIIPEKILAVPRYGFVNVHPSLLPKYRGPSPIQTAILAGEEKTGISIMVLDVKVDHGPILAQKEIPIEKDDTHLSLIEKLAPVGATLLIKTLPCWLDGAIEPQPQNQWEATFTKHIAKQDGLINLKNPPDPQTLDRMIRAFYPWPTVWTEIEVRIKNKQSFSKNKKSRKLKLKFLPPTILPAYQPTDPFVIQPESKRPMAIKEFLNGYQQAKDLVEKLIKP